MRFSLFFIVASIFLLTDINSRANITLNNIRGKSMSLTFLKMFKMILEVFSLFSIVQFPNQECTGLVTDFGTCYTSGECSAKGGTASGNCAAGFGVCCKLRSLQINFCVKQYYDIERHSDDLHMQLSDFHQYNLHQKPRIPQLLYPIQCWYMLLHH